MVIKAGNLIIGGVVGESQQPTAASATKTDKILVANLAELRNTVSSTPPAPTPRVVREKTVEDQPVKETKPKKRVSKYLTDMYNTANLPSFDEEDK